MYGNALESKPRQATRMPGGGVQNYFARQGIFLALPSKQQYS